MKMNDAVKTLLLSTTVACTTGAFTAPAFAADAEDTYESNDTVSSATELSSSGTPIQLTAKMGFADNPQYADVDFYQFTAKAGDSITIDIDNAYKDGEEVDTYIVVFGPAPAYKVLRRNDDSPVDPGSIRYEGYGDANMSLDSRIEEFVPETDGVYTIGVATPPRYFYDGGYVSVARMGAIGTYDMSVSGSSAVSGPKQINIEVKPGNDGLAPLNPRSKGKIPVAILGSSEFSAINVDKTSLTFGQTGDEQSLSKCAKTGEDVNGDGFYDLVCHFENQKAGFELGDEEGTLKGKTMSGEMFEGRSVLKVLPSKKN